MSIWMTRSSQWIKSHLGAPTAQVSLIHRSVRAFLSLLTVLSTTGCSTHRYISADRVHDSVLQTMFLSAIHERYPDSCRLTQRIVVRAGRKDFDMTGYLYLKPDGSWLALALGDMGIELFRFQCADKHCDIITKPASFPDSPLYDGVIGDIQHLFAPPRQVHSYLVQRAEPSASLVLLYDHDRLDEFQFSEGYDFPVRSVSVCDGRVVREVTYHSPTAYPGVSSALPGKIVLHNHQWHYTMEVTLLDVRKLQ